MTTTHPVTVQNARLLDIQERIRELLANFPQLGVVSSATVTRDIGVRVHISSEDTRNPAAVLLAWAALLDHPKVTGNRPAPMFTYIHVQGMYADESYTVTASFGEEPAAELIRETLGELTVQDLHNLQIAGVR